MNRRLLEQVEALAKENKSLNSKVSDLSKKVEDGGKAEGEGKSGGKKGSGEPPDSGLTGPDTRESLEQLLESQALGPEGTGARSGGPTLIQESQGVGNRKLGKIPLKPYLDYGRQGVGFETADQEYTFKLRTEFQVDAMNYMGPAQDPTHSGFYLPRSRFYFQGRFSKPIDYQLSFQQSYTSFGFLNVYLNFNYNPKFQFRAGRFKVPFTYEWYMLNNWRLITPERSLFDANFGLNRQVGLMEWGELFDDRLEYSIGVFDGPRNSSQTYAAHKDVIGMINVKPFEKTNSFLRNLNIGGSFDYGKGNNPLQPSVLRTNVNASGQGLTSTDPIANATVPFLAFNNDVKEKGTRQLFDLHLAYYYKGLSFYGDWGTGFDSYARTGSRPVRLPVNGYALTAAYLITGETVNDRVVVDPIKRFDLRPGKFGLGAWEPFVRYSELGVGQQVFTQGLADPNLWTNHVQLVDVGVNWYLNKALKVYIDWEYAMFGDQVYYRPGGWEKTNNLLWLRFQYYF